MSVCYAHYFMSYHVMPFHSFVDRFHRPLPPFTRTGNAGIASHFEDEESFGPVIATISLISPTLMTLKKPKEHNNDCEDLHEVGSAFRCWTLFAVLCDILFPLQDPGVLGDQIESLYFY